MQNAQQKRYEWVAAKWTKGSANQMSQFVFLEQAAPIYQSIAGAADLEVESGMHLNIFVNNHID